jgi:hypothetical protein
MGGSRDSSGTAHSRRNREGVEGHRGSPRLWPSRASHRRRGITLGGTFDGPDAGYTTNKGDETIVPQDSATAGSLRGHVAPHSLDGPGHVSFELGESTVDDLASMLRLLDGSPPEACHAGPVLKALGHDRAFGA